jgi:Translocon-associated protein (TRAP), alpha subunit
LAVSVKASFPASEIFGIKLVNGEPTQALVSFVNEEPSPVTVNFIGGSLWTPNGEGSQIVRNLTTTKYNVEIPAGDKETLPFSFMTEMHPQDLRLDLISIVSNDKGKYFTVQAFDGTVSVVEAETSVFDPQM